jgi:hypothetical protein
MALHLTPGWIAKQPVDERIALARALLAGTGRVVARDAGGRDGVEGDDWDDGWNACRAAMLGEGE